MSLIFEQKYLGLYTPCIGYTNEQLIEAIAIVHIKFILIHPFREGNGRLSRLLADVMAVQAGFQPLDYSSWDRNKSDYFKAIQYGMNMDYEPMKAFVKKLLAIINRPE